MDGEDSFTPQKFLQVELNAMPRLKLQAGQRQQVECSAQFMFLVSCVPVPVAVG
jgi:hypothetical protein